MDEKKLEQVDSKADASKKKLFAKRSFVISQNTYFREIKSGEDISDVPEVYWPNLKTESVI